VAEVLRRGPALAEGTVVIVNLSGRGDKDASEAAALLGHKLDL
jgi:tryptophan synthase beta subunit